MRQFLFFSLPIIFLATTSDFALAQTLTERLIAEKPSQLVEDARESGSVVRGAILFHQGNINCAKCHRPASEKDRIGPDISRLGNEVTAEQIVDSILQPSKTISKGYETVIVLTDAGESFSGDIVSENKSELIIRDGQDVEKLITIPKDEIEGRRPGQTSTMPDDLMNELKDRKQFLDLLRYVLDIKERGPTQSFANGTSLKNQPLPTRLRGLALIQEHNCLACHTTANSPTLVDAKMAPDLSWSAKHLNPSYLVDFIANPHEVDPKSTMPALLGTNARERNTRAKAIMSFLTTKFNNQFENADIDSDRIQNGHELFHSTGCVACHSPRDLDGLEKASPDSEPMGDVSRKHSLTSLVEFLKDPHAVRASGRMPNMKLTHFEATDIANFLLQPRESIENRLSLELDQKSIDEGREHFTRLNCAKCHSGVLETNNDFSPPRLEQLNPNLGCLSGKTGNWPRVALTDSERQDIQAAIREISSPLTNKEQIYVSLKSFNCLNCHERDSFGGVTDLRNPHFQTEDLNLGEQGRIPPTLTGVGAKLNREWMRDVFVNRRSIRPYMKTRMPQYGEDNIAHLLSLFEDTDELPQSEYAAFDDQKKMREMGHQLAGNKGLNCVACHTFQYKKSDTMPAVDLTEMSERLKKDWFYQYMLAPQKFSPNTVMPSFWPDGIPIRADLEGTPELQIEAIWQYLLDGRQARMPSGVVRERLEIVVKDEAQMLRRSYPGIGKRGIGVGYPGGINIAFDAEQLRLAMVWKGKFVDPGGVWTGQGSGTARPMGKTIGFAKGPQVDALVNPWVVDDGRPPQHRFRGYELDAQQRPTFLYDFGDAHIQDFFEPVRDARSGTTYLRRTVTVQADSDLNRLSLRLASGESIDGNEGKYKIDQNLTVVVASEHESELFDTQDKRAIRIPFNARANESYTFVIHYYWD